MCISQLNQQQIPWKRAVSIVIAVDIYAARRCVATLTLHNPSTYKTQRYLHKTEEDNDNLDSTH